MNRWLFVAAYACCAALAAAGCSIEDVKSDGMTGGASGMATTGGSTTAGTGTAGAPATAGTVATGGVAGAPVGSAGAAGTAAGTTATGGAAPMAGAGGVAGAQAGAPNAGQGGAAENPTPATLVPGLDGFLWIGTCASAGAGLDCAINDDNNACPTPGTGTPFAMRGAFRRRVFNVMGTQGRRYRINFEVRGVTGGKNYMNGTRGPMATTFNEAAGVLNDGWYIGGTPTDSLWNTYEIRVAPAVPNEANVYYTNGFVAGQGDGWHGTVAMRITASFLVLGGGTIELVIHDSNCQGQQNCGPTADTRTVCVSGPGPRTVDLTGMDPMPANFTQPYTQTNQLHPQWLLWDVKSVAAE